MNRDESEAIDEHVGGRSGGDDGNVHNSSLLHQQQQQQQQQRSQSQHLLHQHQHHPSPDRSGAVDTKSNNYPERYLKDSSNVMSSSNNDHYYHANNNHQNNNSMMIKNHSSSSKDIHGSLAGRNQIWSTGQNSYGELMLGTDLTERLIPQKSELVEMLALNSDIIQVVAGNEHTAFLCANGDVYTCGYNDSGQCGLGHTKPIVQTPSKVMIPENYSRVVKLFSFNGCEHIIALCENGEILSWGYGLRGQLGHGTTTNPLAIPVTIPTRVEFFVGKIVVSVSCSYHHSIVTTKDLRTYTFGRNDFGQLGLGDRVDRSIPELVQNLNGVHVQAMCCGQVHTVISTLNPNSVQSCGKSEFYQLGNGTQTGRITFAPVEGLLGGSQISSYRGNNGLGVISAPLVVDESSSVLYPNGIESTSFTVESRCVTQLAAGYYHTIAITSNGEVFAWGRNDYAQLGLGHTDIVPVPILVDSLSELAISSVRCGCYHSLFLSEDGQVLAVGRGQYGQLGILSKAETMEGSDRYYSNRSSTSSTATPILSSSSSSSSTSSSSLIESQSATQKAGTSEMFPRFIKTLENKHVTQVAAGFYHSIFLVSPTKQSLSLTSISSSLSDDLGRLLNSPDCSDVTFIVQGIPIHAHRCIIMVRCDPLNRMLAGEMRESRQKEIIMNDLQYDVFYALLEYLYTGRVQSLSSQEATIEFALDLLVIADQFLVNDLKAVCENAVQRAINVDNVAHMFKTADERRASALKKRCFDFMLRNFGRVIGTPGFTKLPEELLAEVLTAASKRGPMFTL